MKKLIFFCSLLIVCACGSGGGGGSSDSDTPLGHLYEVEGRVVGIPAGYSVAVCYDRDGNKACDDNEKPFASVAADGSYKITGTAGDANNVPLIAELSPVSRSAQAFLLYETPAGQRTISVLTTLVKARMDSDPTATFDAAHSDIKAKIGGDAFASSGMDTMINTVNTIIQEMSDRLASLGYGFSRRTQLLITNIILEEVLAGNIGNNQGGDLIDGIGDIEQEMTDLEESSPKVLTVQAFLANNNLKMYMLEYYSNRYEIWNLELSTGQAKTGDGEKVSVLRANSSLPNMYDEIVPARFVNGGGFVFNIEGQDVILYSITQTPIEAIKANPRFANASVPGFPPNSFMYSINLETSLAHRAQSMAELIGIWNSGKVNEAFLGSSIQSATKSGATITADHAGTIVLKSPSSFVSEFTWRPYSRYDFAVLNLHAIADKQGKCTEAAPMNGYTCVADDGSIFVAFDNGAGQWVMASYLVETHPMVGFNETAAKHIRDTWNLATPETP